MRIPDIHCPLPSAINAGADVADARSVSWMRRFSLCANEVERDRLARTGCGRLAARIVPLAPESSLQIMSDFFLWNVAFDDEYCDEGPLGREPGELARVLALMVRTIDVPERHLFTTDRYAVALRDIRCRLDAHATPVQMRQWIDAMRGWFLAETWKAGNVARARMPSLDEYATLRLYSGGPMALLALATIAEGYEVPQATLEDRRVRALTEMAATLCTWMADIASYEKEASREYGGHNLVNACQHEYRCTVDEAVARAVETYHQIMGLFLRLRDRVSLDASGASVELPRYLATLGHLVRCSVDWCHASERYVQSPGTGRTTPPASSERARASRLDDPRTPVHLPSLAWWWTYDPDGGTTPLSATTFARGLAQSSSITTSS